MAKYRISGVWKDSNQVITHYAFHTVGDEGTTRAVKKTKENAIKLLETNGNSAYTWIWDYSTSFWRIGEKVEVVDGKYLRSNADKTETNNLAHLINFDWISL